MRKQQIVTIILEGITRNKYETVKDFMVRIDKALTEEVNRRQMLPAWTNWDLLSVSSLPSERNINIIGFTTTWEYDPERHEDVKTNGEESEEETATDYIESTVNDWRRANGLERHKHIPSQHQVKHGDIIVVNGKPFELTSFTQTNSESDVTFTEITEQDRQDLLSGKPAQFDRPDLTYNQLRERIPHSSRQTYPQAQASVRRSERRYQY